MLAERAIGVALEAAGGAALDVLRKVPTAAIQAVTAAAVAAFLSSMAEAGVSLAHMHEWQDLAKAVVDASERDG
jgi:hypothetical protein